MGGSRTVTLLGSYGLFAGLFLVVVLRPEYAAYSFPAFALPLLWSDFRRDAESPVILGFLATVAGLVMVARAVEFPAQLAVGSGVLGLWVLAAGLAAQRGRQSSDERALVLEQIHLQDAIRDDERDLKYYASYAVTVGSETRLRRDMADAAKSLSGTMDAGEVQARLMSILTARFPGARIAFLPTAGDDPLLAAAVRRRGPILVKDSRGDTSVPADVGFGSGMAVPFTVMREPAGFIKLEHDVRGMYDTEDVRAADLFATMAAMSLENISLYESVHRQATHDALTQLHSHRAFQQRLQEEVMRAARAHAEVSLIMCDVDHFKGYNDRYGHQAGDHLLRTLAGVLASFARPVDFVARYGGEEFAMILPNTTKAEAMQVAERMRARVSEEPFVFQGSPTRATMSFGVSVFPADAATSSQVVRSADERLYKAKHGGRNQVAG